MNLWISTIIFLLTLAGCQQQPQADKSQMWLTGIWKLTKHVWPDGNVCDVCAKRAEYCRIFYGDSTYYHCGYLSSPMGFAITPLEKGDFELVYKGNNEYLYLENGQNHPLRKLNDSTISIQQRGSIFTYVHSQDIPQQQLEKIKSVIAHDSIGSSEPIKYVFSTSERKLEAANHTYVYALLALVVVLLLILNHLFKITKRKRHVEEQLRQITEERDSRPQPVAMALKQVEKDFLSSEYFISLHKQVAEGKSLKAEDYSEMERQIKPVYPNFTHRLYELCKMSPTEFHVCLLIKLRFSPSEMAQVLYKDITTISSIRNRLYKKVFNTKGGAKEWDEFILSL